VSLSAHENSHYCRLARIFAQLCGCESQVESSCTICGGGDIMSNPFQEIAFNFGAINNIYPDKLGGENFTFGRTGRSHVKSLNPKFPLCTHRMTAGVTGISW
jgi:hypothetical protein